MKKRGKMLNKKYHLVILFAVFLALAGYLFYASFENLRNLPLTGTTTFPLSQIDDEDNVKVFASLTIPELRINSKFERVEIIVAVPVILKISEQNFNLEKDSRIVLINYNGELDFDKNNILKLNGRTDRVLIGGLPAESSEPMKVSFDESFIYNSLIVKSVSIRELSYETSGELNLNDNKISVSLFNEQVEIGDFEGDFKAEKNTFEIDGKAKRVKVPGSIDINID